MAYNASRGMRKSTRSLQLAIWIICAGNLEAARLVLKKASALKILSTEQITSLSVGMVEDRSGSIQNGQISHVQ